MSVRRILMALMVCLSGFAMCAMGQEVKKQKEYNIYGSIVNANTGLGTTGDTIKVELMNIDSVVIAMRMSPGVYLNYPDPSSVRHEFRFNQLKADDGNFLIRLSHPDYETAVYDFGVNTIDYNVGTLRIRKLTRFEKNMMLGEVTVTASVVAFVNKGDTIQYNADAFQVAQGSMLDKLIDQMPGAEIRENGQIYVNGRFVDKLLLDGKDFFKGDQLVLLQNLPAYTVKDIRVYEKAEGATEVLGKGAMNLTSRDKYVMDVRLKKGYNAGWIANAEAAVGTHDRYRGRGFGLGYTDRLRLSVYGLINNLNETRTPGGDGAWSPSESQSGVTTTKGGGIDYGVFKKDNSMEVNGSVQALYKHTDLNTTMNRQNFLTAGDTYTRQWKDALRRNLNLSTSHSITLRPSEGNNYVHKVEVSAEYVNQRNRDRLTEGTFNSSPGDDEGLRDKLESGMPTGMSIVNRYMNNLVSREKELSLGWTQRSTIAIPNTSNGITISSDGYYMRGDSRNMNDYLLEYEGSDADVRDRSNPKRSHSYKYWVGATGNFRLNSRVWLSPFYAFSHVYSYNGNKWLTDDDVALSPTMVREAMMRLDPNNSYTSGFSHTHHLISTIFSYENNREREGQTWSTFNMYVQPGMNIVRRKLYFHGVNDQTVSKSYVEPECMLSVNGFLGGMAPYLYADYAISGTEIDLMNMVDVVFDSDPLNPRMGNRDLKRGTDHVMNIGYQSKKWLFGRLLVDGKLTYHFTDNATVMGYAYDRSTGVRTFKPFNVNGTREGILNLQTTLTMDRTTRTRRLLWRNVLIVHPSRYVDVVSYDGFATLNRSVVNAFEVSDNMRVQYGIGRYTQLGVEGQISSRHATSERSDFNSFTVVDFSYGVTGRTRLPWDIEISTGLKMYSTRGYDDPSMNDNQLIWNGRIIKSIMNGKLLVAIDGYDMLGNLKLINYTLNAQARTETWVNGIPSYVMLTVRWNFAKKPREN